ncbi:MAG TPA: sulfatase-like hydrolase/transferase [Xanthobacteraceae bacterium]|nr:sulfatase-like hydrolase/transferase [Xanthobacteraceae bacterium]
MSISNFFRVSRHWTLAGELGRRSQVSILIIAALYLALLGCMYLTEVDLFGQTLFLLTLGLVNCVWLVVLRRPAIAVALSLIPIALIIVLSKFKFETLWMTISFVDVMVVDADTVSFLLAIYPKLRAVMIVAFVVGVPLLVLLWRHDPFRVPRVPVALGGMGCLAGIIVLSNAAPEQPWEPFQGVNHVSNFTRSGVVAVSELMSSSWLEAAAEAPDRLTLAENESCKPAVKPPHIVLVLDEASFDITAAPGIKVPPGYARHFLSFDGKARKLLVEGSGGPTWYTEYNVLTGLSARSYGRLKFFLTRIAADRVKRGLPHALRRCGYKTFTLYPTKGAFLSARRFQATAGIERFLDYTEMRAGDVEPDHFYYNKALELIEREHERSPLFVFVYTTANHFPWDNAFRPDLTPGWRPPGNDPEVDEYIRRQSMSARDYTDFVARLKQKFSGESFLIVRFGDHQPTLAARILNPSLGDDVVALRIQTFDPQYFTTYYAIDAVNFRPVKLESALTTLDAPYLPLVVLEAAGLPLDASFTAQKRILQRCQGIFYGCRHGAEARIFNRMLIDAGLISGL